MEVREDAHRAALDDVFAEAGEIARPRAAGVDAGRNPAAAREVFGVNAERCASPINVRVQVDEAGRDDEARHVADFGAFGFEALSYFRHLSAGEGDVGYAVKILRGVDDPTVTEDEIEGHGSVFEMSGVNAQAALAVKQMHRLDWRRERDRGAGKESVRVGASRLDQLASDIDVKIVQRAGWFDERELSRNREGVRPAIRGQGEIVRADADEAPWPMSPGRHLAWKQIHLRRADETGDEDIQGGAVDFHRFVELLEDAVVHHRDAVRHHHRLLLVVRDEDDGDFELALQPLDLGACLNPQARVEVGERLVHKERRGMPNDSAPHCDALSLAAG